MTVGDVGVGIPFQWHSAEWVKLAQADKKCLCAKLSVDEKGPSPKEALSISDFRKFRFLLKSETPWWLQDRSIDGDTAYAYKGRILWADGKEIFGIRPVVYLDGKELCHSDSWGFSDSAGGTMGRCG